MMFDNSRNSREVRTYIFSHVDTVEACLLKFEAFIQAAVNTPADSGTLRALAAEVAAAEAEADTALRTMIDSLADALLLPSTKEEVISVATSCDAIANKCEGLAFRMVRQRLHLPEAYGEDLLSVMAITRRQFALLEESINLLFSNFSSLQKDHSILDEIRAEESRVDAIESRLDEACYLQDMDLAHQTQLARFVELMCDLADIIENIADKIQIILITRKV